MKKTMILSIFLLFTSHAFAYPVFQHYLVLSDYRGGPTTILDQTTGSTLEKIRQGNLLQDYYQMRIGDWRLWAGVDKAGNEITMKVSQINHDNGMETLEQIAQTNGQIPKAGQASLQLFYYDKSTSRWNVFLCRDSSTQQKVEAEDVELEKTEKKQASATKPAPSTVRENIPMEVQFVAVDDQVEVYLEMADGHPDILVSTANNTRGWQTVNMPLRNGDNKLKVRVYNNGTWRGGYASVKIGHKKYSAGAEREGWAYDIRWKAWGKELAPTMNGRNEHPDGSQHDKWFWAKEYILHFDKQTQTISFK